MSNCSINTQDEHGQTEFMKFFTDKRWSVENVKIYIDSGANINLTDWCDQSAIHWVAEMADEKYLRLLINAGANIDLRDKLPYYHNNLNTNKNCDSGLAPLMWAIANGLIMNVVLLILSGANLNVQLHKTKCKPLEFAIMTNFIPAVKPIIAKLHDNVCIIELAPFIN